MSLSEQLEQFGKDLRDTRDFVNAVHTDVKIIAEQIKNHTDPNQPCGKLVAHDEARHKGQTIRILKLFSGIVIFLLVVYEGIKALLKR